VPRPFVQKRGVNLRAKNSSEVSALLMLVKDGNNFLQGTQRYYSASG
jgi:hypothetical protein